MEDKKLLKFNVYIEFKDGTRTRTCTYDDNEDGENTLSIDEGCYIIDNRGKDLVTYGNTAYPIKNNIKELVVTFEEVKDEI